MGKTPCLDLMNRGRQELFGVGRLFSRHFRIQVFIQFAGNERIAKVRFKRKNGLAQALEHGIALSGMLSFYLAARFLIQGIQSVLHAFIFSVCPLCKFKHAESEPRGIADKVAEDQCTAKKNFFLPGCRTALDLPLLQWSPMRSYPSNPWTSSWL